MYERRKYRISFTFYSRSEVAFRVLRINYLAVKRLADVLEFSLAANLAISENVFNHAPIGADQVTFLYLPLSADSWQLL